MTAATLPVTNPYWDNTPLTIPQFGNSLGTINLPGQNGTRRTYALFVKIDGREIDLATAQGSDMARAAVLINQIMGRVRSDSGTPLLDNVAAINWAAIDEQSVLVSPKVQASAGSALERYKPAATQQTQHRDDYIELIGLFGARRSAFSPAFTPFGSPLRSTLSSAPTHAHTSHPASATPPGSGPSWTQNPLNKVLPPPGGDAKSLRSSNDPPTPSPSTPPLHIPLPPGGDPIQAILHELLHPADVSKASASPAKRMTTLQQQARACQTEADLDRLLEEIAHRVDSLSDATLTPKRRERMKNMSQQEARVAFIVEQAKKEPPDLNTILSVLTKAPSDLFSTTDGLQQLETVMDRLYKQREELLQNMPAQSLATRKAVGALSGAQPSYTAFQQAQKGTNETKKVTKANELLKNLKDALNTFGQTMGGVTQALQSPHAPARPQDTAPRSEEDTQDIQIRLVAVES